MVLNAESADKIVVVARTNGSQVDEEGISLFLIDGSVFKMLQLLLMILMYLVDSYPV